MRERLDLSTPDSADSFEGFYMKEYPSVVSLAYALSGSRWVAEDLAQEAFLVVHTRWDAVSGYDRPEIWVRRVVANLSVSALRRRVAEAKAVARMSSARAPDSALSVETIEFWRAVRSLPRRQKQVIALHYVEDLPIAGIAQVLEIAEGTVKKHLHDGRATLALRLGLDDEGEP